MIPIVIICYNNWVYVDNTIKQLKFYHDDIIIMDNKSTDPWTIDYLNKINVKVIWNETNNGPWITPDNNTDIWNTLPNQFILTDPDLQFNKDLPSNFIDYLLEVSNLHNAYKVGFALDISDFELMHQIPNYHFGQNIYQWEHSQHWTHPLGDDLYLALIDTTFCLISKNKNPYNNVRIAGNFTAKHIPWYVDNSLYNVYSGYQNTCQTTKISNMSSIINKDIVKNYSKISKNNEIFFIKNDDPNLPFWKNTYLNWESETFDVFDAFLKNDKTFIDIGAWVGTTSMYASRLSKKVYSIEADRVSNKYLTQNCKNNCNDNVIIINKAIYSQSDQTILFGSNNHLNDSSPNDSTSQLFGKDGYPVQTISFLDLIKDISDISLVKVDIEGGEEYILDDLYTWHQLHGVPMYISFHYTWWTNLDLSRFKFLEKYDLKNDPFKSILFCKSNFKYLYGTDKYSVDITEKVYLKCFKNGIITIPTNDEIRAKLFGDPLPGILKWVYIEHPDTTIEKYSDNYLITIQNDVITSELIIKPVIVAIAKFESDYILEWVDYHISLGFEKIYLYDNEDIPVYQELIKSDKVHVIHLPGNNYNKPVQYFALDHFINNFILNKNISHVIHMDIDEFISLKKHTLKEFIKEYITGNCAGIGINWRHFGDSGKTTKTLEPVTKRFTMCESIGNKTIKTLFDKNHFNGWRICHCINPKEGYLIKSTSGEIIEESYTTTIDYSIVQLNHYKCKTRPEFEYARTRGRCDISDTYLKTDNDNFDRFNFNDVQDLTAYNGNSLNEFLHFKGIVPVEGNVNNLSEQMEDLIFLSKNVKSILEIGFNAGHSSELFLKNNKNVKVTSFDLGEHQYVYTSKDYLDTIYKDRHTLIIGDSTKTIPGYPDSKFDLIFIDGGHQLDIAQQDLLNCMRFAHQDTILVMDDIVYHNHANWTIGPTRAWTSAKNKKMIKQDCSKEYSQGRGMCWGKYLI